MKNLLQNRKNVLLVILVLCIVVATYAGYRKYQNKQTQKKVDAVNPQDAPIAILVSK